MQLNGFDQVLGIELKIIDQNLYSCRTCLIAKHQSKITIEQIKVVEGALSTVLADLPKRYPVALTLTGKGILYKNIEIDAQTPYDQVVKSAFPAIDTKDFYNQQFNVETHFSVAVIRKQMADELLDKLKLAGFRVYILSLSGLIAVHILSQLNSYGNEIQFDSHLFKLSDGNFLSYSAQQPISAEFEFKIGQELIQQEAIVAYASAFQLMLHQNILIIHANAAHIDLDFSNAIATAQLKKQALFFLFALFGLLLISFMLFTYYNKENAALAMKVGSQTANADQTDLLKKTSSENITLLKQLNWNGGYNYGFILNEIGQCMPKQLTIQKVLVNNFKTAIEKVEKQPNIKIFGITDNLTAVNNWIFILKEKPWIKSVKLLKYQEDQEEDNYQFNLAITY